MLLVRMGLPLHPLHQCHWLYDLQEEMAVGARDGSAERLHQGTVRPEVNLTGRI